MTAADLILLIERVARRDRAAFRNLYDLTAPKLYGVVLRIVRRREVADDVLQDVYVKIWDQAHRFEPAKGSAIAWLATIARNRALDDVRARGRMPLEPEDAAAAVADDRPSALALLEAAQDVGRLRHCLDGLEPERKSLVLAAYIDGASREELAERVGAPVGTIKTWLHRSLKHLKDCLTS